MAFSRCSLRRHGGRCSHAAWTTPGAVASRSSVQLVMAANSAGHVSADDVHHRLPGRVLLLYTHYAISGEYNLNAVY